jgi:hypothetical protein
VCSAPVGRFASSNTDGRPMPQWLGGKTDLLRSAGFRLAELKTGYARGPRPMTFMYEGQARTPKVVQTRLATISMARGVAMIGLLSRLWKRFWDTSPLTA